VPDIFATDVTVRKATAPVVVPSLNAEEGFSLLPSGGSSGTKTPSRGAVPSTKVRTQPQTTATQQQRQPSSQQPPPPPPPLVALPNATTLPPPPQPSTIEHDDSFDDDDETEDRLSNNNTKKDNVHEALRARLSDVERLLAQSTSELAKSRAYGVQQDDLVLHTITHVADMLAKILFTQVAQLQAQVARARRREHEESQALSAALGAIEAKLEAAVARAASAEAEVIVLRNRLRELESEDGGGATTIGTKLREANKTLRRVTKQAANLSLEFRESSKKSEESLRALIAHTNTMNKLAILLASLEKVVVVDEEDGG
jgi:hypothetical protein